MLYRAAASLPSEDREHASAALHEQLRVIAGAVGSTPDWATFHVDGPTRVPGWGGQCWFEWSATVSAEDSGEEVDPDVWNAEPTPAVAGQTQPFAAPGFVEPDDPAMPITLIPVATTATRRPEAGPRPE